MKKIAFVMFFLIVSSQVLSDTQDYIRARVILVKSNIAYFDKGAREGAAPGETFEIYFEGGEVSTGRIAWADRDISRSEPLDSANAAQISSYYPLDAKIRLLAANTNRGGHLTISIFSEPHLDPAAIATPGDMMVARLVHRGLLTHDSTGSIVPDLCSDYEIRDLTYTFYIKPEAGFHDGRSVEASDVLYSFETLARAPRLTPFSSFVLEIKGACDVRAGLKNEIAGIFIIDNKTLSITLERPFPNFEDYLAGPAGYIIPRPGLVSSGTGIVGAGPYRVSWYGPEGIVVEPFGDPAESAFLDSLTFVHFSRSDEAGFSFELGRLDMVNLLGEPSPKFVSKGNFTSRKSTTDAYVILGINCARKYQADGKFGKALSFMFDRETLIRVILGGSGETPTYQVPGRPDLAIDLSLPFMPDSAAYYIDSIDDLPSSINLFVDSRYPVLANVSRYLIGQLQKHRIRIIERRVDFQLMEEASARSDLDLYLTYYIPIADNPECTFYPLLNAGLSGETNFLNFDDEAIQAFLDRLHTEAGSEKRDNIAQGLIQAIAAEPPVVFLYKPYLVSINKDDVAGAEQDPLGFVDLRKVFIEKGK